MLENYWCYTGITNLTMSGDLTVDGNATITTADNSNTLSLVSTDADATSGPRLSMRRESGSPADNDIIGQIYFTGKDDGGNNTDYASIRARISSATHNTEDGALEIQTYKAGSFNNSLTLAPTETVFNNDSVDIDFRVESNGNANMLFVDGGNDRIGIGTASPDGILHLDNGATTKLIIEKDGGGAGSLIFHNDGSQTSYIQLDASEDMVHYGGSGVNQIFYAGASERMRVTSVGKFNLKQVIH